MSATAAASGSSSSGEQQEEQHNDVIAEVVDNELPILKIPLAQKILIFACTNIKRTIELELVCTEWNDCINHYGVAYAKRSMPSLSRYVWLEEFYRVCRLGRIMHASSLIDQWVHVHNNHPAAIMKKVRKFKNQTCLHALAICGDSTLPLVEVLLKYSKKDGYKNAPVAEDFEKFCPLGTALSSHHEDESKHKASLGIAQLLLDQTSCQPKVSYLRQVAGYGNLPAVKFFTSRWSDPSLIDQGATSYGNSFRRPIIQAAASLNSVPRNDVDGVPIRVASIEDSSSKEEVASPSQKTKTKEENVNKKRALEQKVERKILSCLEHLLEVGCDPNPVGAHEIKCKTNCLNSLLGYYSCSRNLLTREAVDLILQKTKHPLTSLTLQAAFDARLRKTGCSTERREEDDQQKKKEPCRCFKDTFMMLKQFYSAATKQGIVIDFSTIDFPEACRTQTVDVVKWLLDTDEESNQQKILARDDLEIAVGQNKGRNSKIKKK